MCYKTGARGVTRSFRLLNQGIVLMYTCLALGLPPLCTGCRAMLSSLELYPEASGVRVVTWDDDFAAYLDQNTASARPLFDAILALERARELFPGEYK